MFEEFNKARAIDKAVFYFLVLGGFIAIYLLCTAAPADNNVNNTISSIKQQQREVGNEISNAGNNVSAARKATAAASDRISRSQELARQSAEQIDKCRAIVRECQDLANANRAILTEVGTRNSTGKKKE